VAAGVKERVRKSGREKWGWRERKRERERERERERKKEREREREGGERGDRENVILSGLP